GPPGYRSGTGIRHHDSEREWRMRLDEAPRRGKPRSESSDLWSGKPAAGSSDAAWRTGGAGIFSAVRLALLRASHTRWLLLVVAVGILVADVLISTVPLYNTIVPNIQLQNAMARADSLQSNMQVIMSTPTVDQGLNDQVSRGMQLLADSYLASFSAPHPTIYLTSGLLSLDQAGAHTFGGFNNTAQAHLQGFDFAALRPYLHILQGVPPQTPSAADAGQPIQVMITQEMADDWHVSVGGPVMLSALTSQYYSRSPIRTVVKGTVTAIFEPVNAHDPFWNDLSYINPSALTNSLSYVPPIYPILTTTDSFFSALAHDQYYNGVSMTQTWVYYADPNRITTANMADDANGVITFRNQLTVQLQGLLNSSGAKPPGYFNVSKGSVQTLGGLDQIIQSAQQQLSLILLPLYVIAAQVVGVALLFVAAMAALLIEQQSQ